MKIVIIAIFILFLSCPSNAGIQLGIYGSQNQKHVNKKNVNYEKLLNRLTSRRGVMLYLNILILRGELQKMHHWQYEKLQHALRSHDIYVPHFHHERIGYTKNMFLLFGFVKPNSEQEEFNILESSKFKMEKRRLHMRYHPDRANKKLSDFWWPIINQSEDLMERHYLSLQKKKSQRGRLEEHPIYLTRSADQMVNGKISVDKKIKFFITDARAITIAKNQELGAFVYIGSSPATVGQPR